MLIGTNLKHCEKWWGYLASSLNTSSMCHMSVCLQYRWCSKAFPASPPNEIFSWTSFLLLENSELMHTSSLVAYHITSFMLYESSYTDVC